MCLLLFSSHTMAAVLAAGFLLVRVTSVPQRQQLLYSSGIPNPMIDASSCHMRTFSFLCDPNDILTAEQKKTIAEESIGHFFLPSSNICGPKDDEIQVAVAIIRKMDVHHVSEDDEDNVLLEMAKELAIQTHNDWGVGTVHESCEGTGVLLFLSVEDKTCFISVGKALSNVLTDWRLDYIISKVMKPDLRLNQYDKAIMEAVRQIKSYVNQGPPALQERMQSTFLDFVPFILFMLLALTFVRIAEFQQRRSRSEYAAVCSQLNEIERSRALALQGEYNCKSCPICLEPFQINSNSSEKSESKEEKKDAENEKLLRDVSIGSDGLPVKLLRCGHVFDETCWNEWAKNGRGDPTVCPICRTNIGKSFTLPHADTSERFITSSTTSTADVSTPVVAQHSNEMNFRLNRLMLRYPRYISQSNIILWSQDGYDGPITRDPDFIRRDPGNHSYSMKQERCYTTSFGGGKSSGGRGGKW